MRMLNVTLCLILFVLLGSTTGCEVIRTADMAFDVFKLVRAAYQLGGPTNDVNELKELQLLAERGNAESQNKVGEVYDYGWGVSKDDKEAGMFRPSPIWIGCTKWDGVSKWNLSVPICGRIIGRQGRRAQIPRRSC